MNGERGVLSSSDDPSRWQAHIACRAACPVGTDARAFVIAIGEGRYLDAYRIARATNPFASVCGRICPAPCETACTRGKRDEPVAIRALERFVCEQYGPESAQGPALSLEVSSARRGEAAGRRVAIAGAGVAGFTAAHDLALLGYSVTVFEAGGRPGGALLQVPENLLAPRVRDAEISAILSLGMNVLTGVRIGADISVADLLKQGFEAVCLATGGALVPFGERKALEASSGVFAVCASDSVVEAVAAGQRAAEDVDSYLTGVRRERVTAWAMSAIPLNLYEMPLGWDQRRREMPLSLPAPTLGDARPIELSYSERQAREQAFRCLKCHISPVLDLDLCTLCGVCADICPEQVIFLDPGEEPETGIRVDESGCTRCGVCARVCPEDAITMRAFEDETELLPIVSGQ